MKEQTTNLSSSAPLVWDARKCVVGEGPVATGTDLSKVYWVDILNNRALWRDLASGEWGEIETSENVSFVLPRSNGGLILGTANGPESLDSFGTLSRLPGRIEADGSGDPIPMRWNDAKVGPCGEIWLGTSAYGAQTVRIGLHRLDADGKSIKRVLSGMKLSNGMDWSPDGKIFYLIDTVELTLFSFDYKAGEISNQRVAMKFDPSSKEYPDGMSVDSAGSLWIAFWNGACVRRYSSNFELLETISLPVRFVSSCAFAGSDLSTLVITTSTGDNGWHDEHELAGMTFTIKPPVKGKASYVYPS
jgi:sugar lactone lactonase YvrE